MSVLLAEVRSRRIQLLKDPAGGELLREVVEEYIFERAFQAESLEEEEDLDAGSHPEQSGSSDRDTQGTGGEKNRRATTLLPQNGYPALTSPENTDRNAFGQEQA